MSASRYTDPDFITECRDLYTGGLSIAATARQVRATPETVWWALVRNGVQLRPRPKRDRAIGPRRRPARTWIPGTSVPDEEAFA
jgi:hypothetical protein